MTAQTVMMSGLPGKMATLVAETILKRGGKDIEISTMALTGSDQPPHQTIAGTVFSLMSPLNHEAALHSAPSLTRGPVIVIDFTQPDAVNRNAELYCEYKIPFVMGTTGGDRKALEQRVIDSGNVAVIAPNMAKPIVLIQAMVEYAAKTFPGALEGFQLFITESHQSSKKDTSGTAKAMVSYFNMLSIPINVEDIVMIRDPKTQRAILGVPEKHLAGHGYHSYNLTSSDGTVRLAFKHDVDGRQIYADGTIDAIKFLSGKIKQGSRGEVYSMIDVLKGETSA